MFFEANSRLNISIEVDVDAKKYSLRYFISTILCFSIILTSYQSMAVRSHKSFVQMYQLVEPYQIPNRTKLNDLENIHNCECPRVYWPACATNNITYVNACILNCLKLKLRRLGPCITFRRANRRQLIIYVPSAWRVHNSSN